MSQMTINKAIFLVERCILWLVNPTIVKQPSHISNCTVCQRKYTHEELFGEPIPIDRTDED